MSDSASAPGVNTDRELWRGPDEGNGSFYADSIRVTKSGGIGINVAGHVIVKPLRDWHKLACTKPPRATLEREAIKSGIDETFSKRGLYIDWELRNEIVDAILALRRTEPKGDWGRVTQCLLRCMDCSPKSENAAQLAERMTQTLEERGFLSYTAQPKPGEREAVAWLDIRTADLGWQNRIVATNPQYVENNGPENFVALAAAGSHGADLCDDCPPVGYETDKTRCLPCPRRAPAATRNTSSDGGVEGHPPQATGEAESADVRQTAGVESCPSETTGKPSDPTPPAREAVAWQYAHKNTDHWYMLRGGADPTEFLKQWPAIEYDVRPLYAALSTPQEQAPRLKPWQDELSEIIGHLGAAITQSIASDDQIIMDHVKAAHEIAKIVRRKA